MTLATETDSFPRIFARDLFLVLRVFDQNAETSLENIRLRICVDRKKQRRGTFLWSVASDAAGELVRLGLIEGSCHAKNAQQYKVVKANRLRVTAEGGTLLQTYRSDRARAYDRLLELLSASHAYLRRLIVVLNREMILAPVISSMRDRLRLAGRGEKIHEMVCRCGGRVPIREVCRARSTTATIRTDLGVSGTLGTCGASNASNETRRS